MKTAIHSFIQKSSIFPQSPLLLTLLDNLFIVINNNYNNIAPFRPGKIKKTSQKG